MNKKMCFLIFVAAVIALIAGIVFKIGVINNLRDAIFAHMQNFYVCVSAIVCAVLLAKNKYYWLLIIGCAVVAALLIQFFMVGNISNIYQISMRAAAFLVYAYLTALIRFMI